MNKKEIYKRIMKLVSSHSFLLSLSIILSILSVLSALYMPVLTGRAIDACIDKGMVDFESIKKNLFLFVLALLVNGFSTFFMSLINNKVTFKIVKDLRNRLFDKIHRLPVVYLDSKGRGDILSRIISDVERLSDGLLLGFSQLFTGVFTVIATLVFMAIINPWLALTVLLLTPISLVVASFISRKTYKHFSKQASLQGELTSFINETVSSQRLITAMDAKDIKLKTFNEKNEEFAKVNLKALFYSSTTNPSTRFVNGLVYTSVGVFGGLLGIKEIISVGTLVAFLSYATQYTKPFNEISGVITEFQNAIACAGRIFDFLEAKETIDLLTDESPVKELTGDISINNLSFSYDKTKKLLYDISFHVKKGEHIAIVGPTGCGKTTFINLLMRFYEPDGGEILFDNEISYSIKKSTLRKNIGFVLQDTWVKNATIKENIAFGKPDATMEEIIDAAKKSHAHSFISKLEKGYDTVVNQEATNLSAGQKQLLCIARVMLALPPILILDEATSSIDTMTEQRITKAFEALMEGRTSFIVAHRLSTIKNANLILVMKDGNIIEQGTHEELLVKKGFYYSMLHQN